MNNITELLMTYDEYQEKAYTPGKSYIFSIEKHGQIIDYVGVGHIYNLKDEQVDGLRKNFSEFVQRTNGINRIILIEGGPRPVADSEREAMKAGGEPNLVTYWATNEGIEIYSPEPGRQDEANHLLKNFTKEEIMHYYFARQVNHWNLMKRSHSIENHIERALNAYKGYFNWDDFDFTLENMIRIHKEISGREFNPDDWEFFQILSNPRKNMAVTNKVCAESSRFRDTFIVSEIVRLWREGKNIFIVYGRTHAVMQEPAIRKLLT